VNDVVNSRTTEGTKNWQNDGHRSPTTCADCCRRSWTLHRTGSTVSAFHRFEPVRDFGDVLAQRSQQVLRLRYPGVFEHPGITPSPILWAPVERCRWQAAEPRVDG
jgi:hypothetical protein